MPFLSIVIPTFNSLRYSAEAVRSSLGQTLQDVEVVVDDNASSDGTVSQLKEEFGHDARLKIFAHHEDLNIPHGWNRAMSEATGEFTLLLHSDNLLHPQFAEALKAAIDLSKRKVIYSECHYFEGETPPHLFSPVSIDYSLPLSSLHPGYRAVNYVFRWQRMIPTSATAIHKSCLSERKPYDAQFAWDPDIELLLWLSNKFGVAHLDLPLAAIRTHPGQAGSWKTEEFSKGYRLLLRRTQECSHAEPHVFFLTWAISNQDISQSLARIRAPFPLFVRYLGKWVLAELAVPLHFLVEFLRKMKLLIRTFATYWVKSRY